MRWDPMADLEARAELGVGLDAGPEEVRAAYLVAAQNLMEVGNTAAFERATAAYRTLLTDAARPSRPSPRPGLRWAAAGLAVVGLFVLGLMVSQAVRPPAPTSRIGPQPRPTEPAPLPGAPASTPFPVNAQMLVLSAGDLGPGYSLVRATPAVLGPASAGAFGWDAVFTSTTTGALVESIAVVYPTADDAAKSAMAMNGLPADGTSRVARAIGPVLVISVVAPGNNEAGDRLAQQVSILEIRRVIAASS